MATMDRVRDRGRRQARRLLGELGGELRDARTALGFSQTHVADVAGLTQSRVSRTERGERLPPRLDELTRHSAAVGLDVSIRVYPSGTPVRDAGQLRLLRRLRAQVSDGFRWHSEVAIGGHGDLRAWDAMLTGPGRVAIDAETRLHDLQALQRRTELKWRDSGEPALVLLVAGTRHNRAVLREYREALASTLPLDTADVMKALRNGHVPEANGIVIL